MKLYRTTQGIIVEDNNQYYQLNGTWEQIVNRTGLYLKLRNEISKLKAQPELAQSIINQLLPPIDVQEVWAAGVTYVRSKVARMDESKDSGADVFYNKVYDADRPEI